MRGLFRLLVCAVVGNFIFSIHASSLSAAPTSIIYQGSLKQSGVVVNGTYPMIFNITNSDGSQVYWTSGSTSAVIKEGLYRVELTPSGVDWAHVDPYIETRVNGTTLLPREKISNSPYALIAKDLIGGATVKGTFQVNRTGSGTATLSVNGANQTRSVVAEITRDFDNATVASRGGEIEFLPAVDSDNQGNIITTNYWGNSNQGTLTLNAYNQSNQLNINQNGFVGIGKVPQTKLHVYDTNPVLLIEQNSLAPGGAGIQLTAAGPDSSSNAAYVQFHGAGSIWGQTGGHALYLGAADRSAAWASFSSGGATFLTPLHVYNTNPVIYVDQNPLAPGGAGIQLTAAGAGSSANAAYVQYYQASIWNQTNTSDLHFGPANRSVDWARISAGGIYGPNGILLTSSSRLKKNIRQINVSPQGTTLVSLDPANIKMPSFKKVTTDKNAQESIVAVPGQTETFDLPRAIVYKWKNPLSPKMADADFIGFMGDDLPIEAHGLREDGTRDPEKFYLGAVVGLLCAKVEAQDAQIKSQDATIKSQNSAIKDLLARVSKLEQSKK